MKTAIVVDDDIDSCDVLCEHLELENIQVLGKGYSGEECVDLYQKYLPDLVFLDVMMPVFDGLYALKKIKKLYPDAILIMVTADVTEVTRNKLEIFHPSAIVYKPYDMKNIMTILNELFEKMNYQSQKQVYVI